MKEEWLLNGAVVPVDVETTSALVAEIHRLIDVIGGTALAQQALQALHDENERLNLYEQEPVGKFAKFTDNIWREVTDGSAGVPLYTTPPAGDIRALKEKNSA